jgi:hypothetical protein
MLLTALAGLIAGYLLNNQLATAQQANAPTIAAIANQKGGQDMFGAYDAAVGWPKKLSSIPGHGPWTFGAGQSVFAESANHVFVLQRGELPEIQAPRPQKVPQFGPSIFFPIGRLPWRDATTASPPGNGGTGQLAEEAQRQQVRRRRALGALHPRVRRAGQPRRGLDPVGFDAPAPALRRDQSL